MAGKTVVPLYAAADEAAVRDVLGELKKKGFRVRQSAEAKKSEVLLVFLSAAFAADGAAQERFLAADSAGREIVPIDLDGAPQPELVHGALMARNAITAQGRTAEEIAARVATAPAFAEKKLSGPLGRVLLAAAALLVLGAALWLWKSAPARAEKRETAAILAAAQAKYGLSEEDLAEIQYVYFVADRFYHPNERDYVRSAPDQPFAFCEIWTRKEAYLKMTGEGISTDLTAFDTTSFPLKEQLFTAALAGYCLSVCSEIPIDEGEIQISNIELKSLLP